MTKLTRRNAHEQGFTLIELLIVIVIIGILAGIVLQVLNPARQQRRSAESVLRANTNKACLAMFACAATAQTSAECADWDALGVTNDAGVPEMNDVPLGATYEINTAGTTATVTGELPQAGGSPGDCIFECSYDFDQGVTANLQQQTGSACL